MTYSKPHSSEDKQFTSSVSKGKEGDSSITYTLKQYYADFTKYWKPFYESYQFELKKCNTSSLQKELQRIISETNINELVEHLHLKPQNLTTLITDNFDEYKNSRQNACKFFHSSFNYIIDELCSYDESIIPNIEAHKNITENYLKKRIRLIL
jgi:hypothetical protein